jgi:hypothetical protein
MRSRNECGLELILMEIEWAFWVILIFYKTVKLCFVLQNRWNLNSAKPLIFKFYKTVEI